MRKVFVLITDKHIEEELKREMQPLLCLTLLKREYKSTEDQAVVYTVGSGLCLFFSS